MMVKTDNLVAWRVPAHDETPTDEMIDWLHTMPHEWEGDECGITVADPSWEDAWMAEPGDWVVCAGGHWRVLRSRSAADFVLRFVAWADRMQRRLSAWRTRA